MITDLETKPAALSFDIPAADAQSHSYLVGEDAIHDARRLLRAMEQIYHAPKVQTACRRLAAELKRSGKRAWAAHTLRAKYYQYIGSMVNPKGYPAGDWRICLNHSKAAGLRGLEFGDQAPVSTRGAFLDFYRRITENNQRNSGGAFDELVQIWRTGVDRSGKTWTAIPGYSAWPKAVPATDLPKGWSEANLRRFASDPYDRTAARIGHGKASLLRFPVITTRTTLHVGEYMELDDHEFNQKSLFQQKPMRPLGFGAADILSGCLFHAGFKPTLWDYEDEVRRKLTEREFMWFVIAGLCGYGYRRDKFGTHLIVERGTAAIRDPFKSRLEECLGKYVHVEVGGRFGKPAHSGQFEGRSKGNFRTKALIEGWWNPIDNQTAMLLGQVGKDRDSAPEQLHGAERYTANTMAAFASAGLSPAQGKFPFLPWHEWREAALSAIHAINTDRQHDLEGWERLGFVQPVWRMPSIGGAADQWLPRHAFESLPDAQRGVVQAMLDADPSLVKTIRLSRREVWDAGARELTRLPFEMIPSLVGRENALNGGRKPLPVKRGILSFECAEVDPDPLFFTARRPDGSFLKNDSEYVCFVNPFLPTHLVACEESGASLKVVCVCERYHPVDRTDPDSVHRALGVQSSFEAQGRQRLDLRHPDQAADKAAMIAHNQRLLASVAQPAAPVVIAETVADDCTTDLLAKEIPTPEVPWD